MDNYRVLLTGGAGYVGTMLAMNLLLEGYKVRVLDNLWLNQRSFLPFFSDPDFEFIKGDIRNAKDVEEALNGIDFIYHLAAIVGMPECKRNPELAEDTNVLGTKLINRLRERIPLVYASTISLYGMTDKMCDETDKVVATSLYADTKARGEKEVMETGNAISLRFATLFGFSLQPREGYMIINDFVRDAVMNGQLIIYDKDFKRSFVHLSDAVDAYMFALENYDNMADNVYNIGNPNLNLSKEDIALAIKDKYQYDLFFKEGKDEDKRSYFISYDKIKALGWEAKTGLNRGLDELISGYKVLKELK